MPRSRTLLRILSDINAVGDVKRLVRLLKHGRWGDMWAELEIDLLEFADLALPDDASDSAIWDACQDKGAVLITRNRNADGPDSLEMTLRGRNAIDSMPVFTLADPDRIQRDRIYAKLVADSLIEHLFDLETYRGAGRIYLP